MQVLQVLMSLGVSLSRSLMRQAMSIQMGSENEDRGLGQRRGRCGAGHI